MNKTIIIFGEMAVGKLTVAKEVAKKLDIKLAHNHLSYDLVYSLFERDSARAEQLVENMRFEPYVEAAREGISFVTTHAYAHDYISKTGQSDPEYLLKLERGLTEAGSTPYFIYITASDEAILARVSTEERAVYKKLTDKTVMEQMLKERGEDIAPPLKNLLVIDNTNMTPEEVANKVVDFVSNK